MRYDWKIIGHERILEKLEKAVVQGNIPSAILFVGPEEIGKYRIVRTLAKILECPEDFSHDHEIAKQIEKNIFPDVITINRLWQKDRMEDWEVISKTSNFDQSERKKKGMRSNIISIDDVASFTSRLYEKPNANYKICLIKNIHRMNHNAANAFLKILEEPPPRTLFLMTATHEELLPETVVSRARVMQMNLVPQVDIRQYLQHQETKLSDADEIELITLTQGRPSRLSRFLKEPDFLLQEKTFFHEIANLLADNNLIKRLKFAEKLSKADEEIIEFFNRFLHLLRSLLVEKTYDKQMPLSTRLSYCKIFELIRETNLAKQKISSNVNKRLTLENLFLSFPN